MTVSNRNQAHLACQYSAHLDAEINYVTGCRWINLLSVNPAYVSRKAAYTPTVELQDLPFHDSSTHCLASSVFRHLCGLALSAAWPSSCPKREHVTSDERVFQFSSDCSTRGPSSAHARRSNVNPRFPDLDEGITARAVLDAFRSRCDGRMPSKVPS